MQHNVDFATVVGNTFFNLSFSGILMLLALCLIVAVWCMVPFSVFGLKARLDSIELAQRSQTELLVSEMKRLNEMLRMRLNTEASAVATGIVHQPVSVRQPAAVETPVPEAMRRAAMQIEAEPAPAPQPVRMAQAEVPAALKRPPTLHPARRAPVAPVAPSREEVEEEATVRTIAGQMRTAPRAVRQQPEARTAERRGTDLNATLFRHPANRGPVQAARKPAPQFMQDLDVDQEWDRFATPRSA